ncbi:uncharacterized protein B0T23DRAFT_421015 [Neurospora hispaniola]|uniref:C2H2-type domain-containing protein n=1 Tax=Neurospora hispaniola TaxID=588809 RepID=A0AAJ0I5X9_9PEZI|nr:hypothetical protein B0T23DRAFT_421015 [Neurospora hispaniola]
MDVIKQSRFSLYDVTLGKDITSFVQTIIKNARACEMNTQGQLIAAYEALDGDIQTEITKPDSTTSMDNFLKDIQTRETQNQNQSQPQNRYYQFPQAQHQNQSQQQNQYNQFPQNQRQNQGQQQRQPLVPKNRRLPAPPQQNQQGNLQQPRAYYVNDQGYLVSTEPVNDPTAFQTSVQEVPDQDLSQPNNGTDYEEVQYGEAQQADAHYAEIQPPESEHHDHPDVAWFGTTERSQVNHRCKTCGHSFPSGNKLYNHVRTQHPKLKEPSVLYVNQTQDSNHVVPKNDPRPRHH